MVKNATAGQKGEQIRSDCFVSITPTEKDGIKINLKSKVKTLYGRSIIELANQILAHFNIENAILDIDDSGALPFAIAARIEAAIKQLFYIKAEFLLPGISNRAITLKDKMRRSRLYLPGNNPKLMINAGIYGSDGIILDLEDSVAPEKKYEARFMVRNALHSVDFYNAERMVRINQLPAGLEDLKFIVPHGVNLILIPKCENAETVAQVDNAISNIPGGKNSKIHLMPIIESAKGIINAYKIAVASENVAALAIGLEDYTADIGAQRTPEGIESLFARNTIVNAAAAAGIQAIDSVFSDIGDLESLAKTARISKSIGFSGMGCIHPRQVSIVNESYLPTTDEIEKAKKIVMAFEEAKSEGSGVVAPGAKMIDAPVVKKALRTIEIAINSGMLTKNRGTGL